MQASTQAVEPEVMNSVMQALTVQMQESEPWLCSLTISTVLAEENEELRMLELEIPKNISQQDPVIGEVLKYVLSDHWPKGGKRASNKDIAALVRERQKLHIDDEGLLYRKTTSRSQLLLPKKFHSLVYQGTA